MFNMRIIAFNFTKISAEKISPLKNPTINNHIEFTDLGKDKLDLLKDDDVLKLSFKYSLLYSNTQKSGDITEENKHGELLFEGNVLLSLEKGETKEFTKAWKKKQVPQSAVVPLYNMIFKKCGAKAIPLQEEIGLPSPFLKVPQATRNIE